MAYTTEQLKRALLEDVEGLVDGWVEWCESTDRPTFDTIEEAVLSVRQVFGQRLVERALEVQEDRQPVPEPSCPKCEGRLRNKGEKTVKIESRAGLVEVKRGYYWCAECRAGFFPSGSATGRVGDTLE